MAKKNKKNMIHHLSNVINNDKLHLHMVTDCSEMYILKVKNENFSFYFHSNPTNFDESFGERRVSKGLYRFQHFFNICHAKTRK